MGDDRRNEGSGAVVAIIVILGIVVLIGVLVVFGGAFLFLAAHSDSVIIQTQVAPSPSSSVPTPTDLDTVPGDLGPTELEGVETSADDRSNELEVDANGKILFSGSQVPIAELKSKLAIMKQTNESLKIKLKASGDHPTAKEVTTILKELSIAFEVQ